MPLVVGGDHDDEFKTSCRSTAVDMSIDSYRGLDCASRQVMQAWAARQKPGVTPFTPVTDANAGFGRLDSTIPRAQREAGRIPAHAGTG